MLFTFFLGLLCKESAAVLPIVLIAFFSADKTYSWLQKLKYLWPFFIGITGYVLLRQHFGITNVHQTSQPGILILGFVTFLRSVITDLRLFVFPVDLHYDRSHLYDVATAQCIVLKIKVIYQPWRRKSNHLLCSIRRFIEPRRWHALSTVSKRHHRCGILLIAARGFIGMGDGFN